VIDIGHARCAFYAHLQPAASKVELHEHEHEHVRRGQIIGLVGNTGSRPARTCISTSWTALGRSAPMAFCSFGRFYSEGTITSSLADLETGPPMGKFAWIQ
jgi:hypothetical protein